MAQFEQTTKRKFKGKLFKKATPVDLTPMVDLGFLLITFFVFTTALSEPNVARLVMPKDSGVPTRIKKAAALTLELIRNDSIGWYEGPRESNPKVTYGGFNRLRSVIQHKQRQVAKALGEARETTIILLPGTESTYKNFVDALDEIEINGVVHYFVVTPK